MPEAIDFLRLGAYQAETHFASLPSFEAELKPLLSRCAGSEGPIECLESVQKALAPKWVRGQRSAKRYLLARDLARIIQAVRADTARAQAAPSPEMTVGSFVSEFRGIYEELGDVPIYLVENFPPPFSGMSWSFFNADMEDSAKYGIPFGIYCKTDSLAPLYTEFVLAHEVVHVAIGMIPGSGKHLARGLEEGLADLFGSWMFAGRYGFDICCNLLVWTRLANTGQLWQIYLDNLRSASYLYVLRGFDYLVDLLHSGRQGIKEVERQLLRLQAGKAGSDLLPDACARRDPLLDRLSAFVLCYQGHYVLSPMAKYVWDRLEITGGSVSQLANDLGLPAQVIGGALQEIQDRTFLILVDDGRLDSADRGVVSDDRLVKYDL